MSQKKPTNIVILGSTGSVGRASLDVVKRLGGRFSVMGLSTRCRVELLSEQVEEFSPRFVAIQDEKAASAFKENARIQGVEVLSGSQGVAELAALEEADTVVNSVVGAAGLVPTLRALEAGKRVALANKESLVVGGHLVMKAARDSGGEIIPVDSEHSSLFQCLEGVERDEIGRIFLTASGGPLLSADKRALRNSTPDKVLAHPTWKMGKRITVDSATLINKGFEVVEAGWLFDIELPRISILIHPQSIVHGLVELIDGNVIAGLTTPDMRIPIQRALCYPERVGTGLPILALAEVGELSFSEPDLERFPCLGLALNAAERGGTAPAALNAADEILVDAFVDNRISFGDIAEVLAAVLKDHKDVENPDLETVLKVDGDVKRQTRDLVLEVEGRSRR
ncbi:MAG: 1-deoxy-D-xylulose-5-phosphate reductoisomerase [Candidatus Eisenbacteria bacterium]|nr:1-deoxy-D-xylulose-5-phosphate reductoisomerase [Candidatus Eisenbacteria bacterium]